METMILVAGLAVAGLAGIAAAFYFSMRPGGSRVRAAGPDPAADRRVPASRSRTSPPSSGRSDRSATPERSARADRPARSDRPARTGASAGPVGSAGSGSGRGAERTGASTVIDFTGPQPVLHDSEPAVTGRRARHGDRLDDTPDTSVTSVTPVPGRRAAARHLAEADPDETDDAAKTTRSRRRVGWRKGSDVDEELWPTESFGGVSDEQFWDDLAADKPLATTARTAQPETAARRRPPNSGPLPDLHPVESRNREDSRRATAEGAGTHPQPRLGPDDRTAIQPTVQAAAQPAAQPGARPGATAPLATQPYPTATQPSPIAAQPVRVTPPVRAAQPAGGSHGRSRAAISADEDPLTSPAYSLRAKGSVDGRSRRPDPGREQYDAGQETQAFSVADTQAAGVGYPDRVPPFRQFDRPVHGANGHGRPDGYRSDPLRSDPLRSDPLRSDPLRSDPLRSDPLRSDPRRTDPLRSDHFRPDPLRPADGYGPTGAYPYPQPQPYGEPTSSANTPSYGERHGNGAPVSQPNSAGDPRRTNGGRSPGQAGANGAGDGAWASRPGYPPVNGHRGPYDPRGYDRRLTSLR